MTQITHHLSDELLMAYAAGILPEGFNLVIATHISMCDECRSALQAHEAIGGAVLEDVGTAEMSDTAFDDCLRLIAGPPKGPIEVAGLAQSDQRDDRPNLPKPLFDYVGGGIEEIKWRPVARGVRQAILNTSKEATVRLLYIPAGAQMPDHGHKGTELTLVLQGAFRDEVDRFGPGDIEIADHGLEHTPIAEEGEACICLTATDAPLRFSKLIPRLAQPFFRI